MAKQSELPETMALPAEGFIRINQLVHFIPFSRTTVWRKAKDGAFPRPIKLSQQVTAWRVADVRDWIASQGNCS
ncbi:MAG: AlpA family phage regulatory protein [Candidatus Contendobacter sp.]|nr:MAG: AlpA family phage regulatory protein [Candidatus Contendobacter sp.]